MQEIFIYIDDSGVLHCNSKNRYFVYAGYIFLSNEDKNIARRKYKSLSKKIRLNKGIKGELKACNIGKRNKNALYKVLKNYESLSVTVDIGKIYDRILKDKHSIVRYKDYAMKRIIKEKIKALISKNKINVDEDVTISLFIDNQNIATNGYYNLKGSIYEELKNGIRNFDYGMIHESIFKGDVNVNVRYCDSKIDYLIQASDILANRIFNSYEKNIEKLREIPNHKNLTLP